MFVPDEIWVTANFKETQLDAHAARQSPSTLEIDAYPERNFRGHVASVQPGSGTAFSLLPAENATGNYVKIVQRVPVKIVIDEPPHDVALGPGMSVVPTVRIDPAPSLYERLRGGYERARDRAGASARKARGANPWLIAVLVALATFMEVLDTTIANVALPYIAGGMGVSEDEASWVVTTYLVANAVILTASSFLARLFGRKTFFLICLALFTASSLLCGFAWNLKSLLLFRILQGVGGGGMVPVSQSILADSFPPEKRGQAFALFGVAVVVAPVVGPTLGGWLADNLSWHWCFLINGPVGLLAIALIALILREPEAAAAERSRLKQQGAGSISSASCWLRRFSARSKSCSIAGSRTTGSARASSSAVATVCALAFVLMIPWEISRRNPMIDVRMVATRQFGACFLVMLATGAILLRDDPIPAAAGAAGFRLYRDLGRACALAGRPRHDGDDVRRRPAVVAGSAQISDRRRRP